MARDYYQVLGVSRDASDQQIKKAYRQLALKFHPDINAGQINAEESFKEVTEAYGVLIDHAKREKYERDTSSRFERDKVFSDIFSNSAYQDVFQDIPVPKEWLQRLFNISKVIAYEALIYGGTPRQVLKRSLLMAAAGGATRIFHGVMDIHEDISLPEELALQGGYITIEYRPGLSAKRIRISIPKNTHAGTTLKIKGMGRRNLYKKAGDLYLHITYLHHR